MAVCPFDPATQRMPFKALLDRVFKTRWGTWAAIHIGQRIDPYLMRATRGRVRVSFTAPTVLVTHTGAKTGKRRTTPLLYFTDGANVVLIASKGGAPQHPSRLVSQPEEPPGGRSIHGRRARTVRSPRSRRHRARAPLEARDEALLGLRGLPGAGDESSHSGDR